MVSAKTVVARFIEATENPTDGINALISQLVKEKVEKAEVFKALRAIDRGLKGSGAGLKLKRVLQELDWYLARRAALIAELRAIQEMWQRHETMTEDINRVLPAVKKFKGGLEKFEALRKETLETIRGAYLAGSIERALEGYSPRSVQDAVDHFLLSFVKTAGRYRPGDKVKILPSHNFKHYHGDVGEIEKIIPINKAYVELEKNGRVIVDLDDVEPVGKTAAKDNFKRLQREYQKVVDRGFDDGKAGRPQARLRGEDEDYQRDYNDAYEEGVEQRSWGKSGMDHATPEAKRKYLQEHPDADKSKQRVKPGIHSDKKKADDELRDKHAPFGTVGVLEDLDGPRPRLPTGN